MAAPPLPPQAPQASYSGYAKQQSTYEKYHQTGDYSNYYQDHQKEQSSRGNLPGSYPRDSQGYGSQSGGNCHFIKFWNEIGLNEIFPFIYEVLFQFECRKVWLF